MTPAAAADATLATPPASGEPTAAAAGPTSCQTQRKVVKVWRGEPRVTGPSFDPDGPGYETEPGPWHVRLACGHEGTSAGEPRVGLWVSCWAVVARANKSGG